jgi:hypothetical protein
VCIRTKRKLGKEGDTEKLSEKENKGFKGGN